MYWVIQKKVAFRSIIDLSFVKRFPKLTARKSTAFATKTMLPFPSHRNNVVTALPCEVRKVQIFC